MTYISQKLLSNEKNYSEKEALAIKWALDKMRYYPLGPPNILKSVPRFLGGRAGSTWGPGNRPDPIWTDRSVDLADPLPARPREHARQTRSTAAIWSARQIPPGILKLSLSGLPIPRR